MPGIFRECNREHIHSYCFQDSQCSEEPETCKLEDVVVSTTPSQFNGLEPVTDSNPKVKVWGDPAGRGKELGPWLSHLVHEEEMHRANPGFKGEEAGMTAS